MYKNHTIAILYNQVTPDSPIDVLDIEIQAKWIEEILQSKGYRTLLVPFSLENLIMLSSLHKKNPVLVFNLVDSAPHEENLAFLVPGLLSHMNLPFTGCSLDNLYITTNKILTKRILKAHGVDTPPWVSEQEAQALENTSITRFIIKPTSEDASIGLDENSIVARDRVLNELSNKQQLLGSSYFAEAFIEGREFTTHMYGSREKVTLLTPYEWIFNGYEEEKKEKIITYDAKWTEKSFGYDHITPRYKAVDEDIPLLEKLVSITKKCWNIFNLYGYARVDFRIDKEGKPWVLEVNCNPSFYGFYHLAQEDGLKFEDIVEQIVEQVK
ncbi:MAG: ATP-grasp domain-containing protein [Spirochaetia bacterium]|nr:ATP-grasp domain-containing protein [Spirochaetia bacterium]